MLRQVVLRAGPDAHWLSFERPQVVLTARVPAEVVGVLDEAERRVASEGLYAAGYVSYEAAVGLDSSLVARSGGVLPLVCLGLFAAAKPVPAPAGFPRTAITPDWHIDESWPIYERQVAQIKEQLRLGNAYQVNYTVRYRGEGITDPRTLFMHMAEGAPYAAYLDLDDTFVVSASPELFFRLEGERLLAQPMKGTASRGLTLLDDRRQERWLTESAKDRAENVMITDMVRNDMGRIAMPGSVRVTSLCEVHKYPTVWQMTSTVEARTTASVRQLFEALFPCASVTGAPKISSMRIIADLESSSRGIYTGAIGWFGPQRQAQFNVAIRTAIVSKRERTVVYGAGGGITWDSDAFAEYRECQVKALVLSTTRPSGGFELLETMRWTSSDGIDLLDEHLARMGDSSAYFSIPFDASAVRNALLEAAGALPPSPHRLRLLLDRAGRWRVEATVLAEHRSPALQRIRLASNPIDRSDTFLYHKTTHRAIYDRARRAIPDADDVLLWNDEGFVTETTVANVFIRRGGDLYTPPVDCGLLAGTYRARLLGKRAARERPIHVDELRAGERLLLCNSVRGSYTGVLLG